MDLTETFSWKGRDVAWSRIGSGDPVVFCHGTPWSSKTWARFADVVSDHVRRVRDLTDEQAGRATTASALTLSGLLKHVADTEAGWVWFILGGPDAMGGEQGGSGQDGPDTGGDSTTWSQAQDPRFVVEPGTTLTALLAATTPWPSAPTT